MLAQHLPSADRQPMLRRAPVTRRPLLRWLLGALLVAVMAGGALPGAGDALAQGMSLNAARDAGLVGETPNGYIAAVQNTPEVRQLVDQVNAQRRQQYTQLAQTHGVPLSVIEAQAASALYDRASPGHFLQNANGQWTQR